MGDLKPEEGTRQPVGLIVSQEDAWSVFDRVQAAFAVVPVDVHEAEVDRLIADIRAEARAEVESD